MSRSVVISTDHETFSNLNFADQLAPIGLSKRPYKSVAHILKSKESFGGGLILLGGDRVKTELQPRPEIHEDILSAKQRILSIDLEPEPYDSKEKRRKTRYKELIGMAAVVTDMKNMKSPKTPVTSRSSGNTFSFGLADKKKCNRAAYPDMKHVPCNQYCENMMLTNTHPSKQAWKNRKCSSRVTWDLALPATFNTLPIYTIRVRWKLNPHVPCYTLELVHALLSRHGRIEAIGQHSPNSAIVVFADVQTARRCLRCCKSGACPLICSWWFEEMNNYSTMMHEQSIREEKKYPVHLTEDQILHLQFLLAQKKCDIQRKSYAGLLAYNSHTFVP